MYTYIISNSRGDGIFFNERRNDTCVYCNTKIHDHNNVFMYIYYILKYAVTKGKQSNDVVEFFRPYLANLRRGRSLNILYDIHILYIISPYLVYHILYHLLIF